MFGRSALGWIGKLVVVRHRVLDAVRERAKRLQPGMPMMEVMILLGSPAIQNRNTWVYMPERSGLIIPADALQVSFNRGVYVSHRFQAVVLGERIQ